MEDEVRLAFCLQRSAGGVRSPVKAVKVPNDNMRNPRQWWRLCW